MQKTNRTLLIVIGVLSSIFFNNKSPLSSAVSLSSLAEPATSNAISVSGVDWKRKKHGSLFIIGTALNTSQKNLNLAMVEFNLYDKSGAVIGNASTNISNLGPGQSWKFEALVIDDEKVETFQLKGVTAF